MFKKLILPTAVICFLLSLMCSCNKTGAGSEETTALKIAEDSKGKKYSAIVDSDGFLLLGDRSQLAITVDDGKGKPGKNADGEFVTRVEDFPYTLVAGNEIHTKFMRMPIPEKWKNKSDELIEFVYDNDGAEASFIVNERYSLTVEECKAEIEKIMSILVEGTEENVQLAFGDAVKISYEREGLPKTVFYIFNVEGRTYFVRISADQNLFETINFEEIVNTMKFRKGE